MASIRQRRKVKRVMHEFKEGELKAGRGRRGKVKSRRQAIARIWKAVQSEPEYKDNTTLFILPDFGRDADYDAGGNGFQHHRTGDPVSRTTWMMALGKGVREGVIYDRPMQSIDLVPSLGEIMGFSPNLAQGNPIKELL